MGSIIRLIYVAQICCFKFSIKDFSKFEHMFVHLRITSNFIRKILFFLEFFGFEGFSIFYLFILNIFL